MPIVAPASDASGEFEQLFSQAGFGQVLYPPAAFPVPLPTTLAASTGVWNSGLMYNDGMRYLTLALTSTQAGACIIQMYVDLAGTIARPPVTTAIVANTLLIIDLPAPAVAVVAGPLLPPFASFTINITNTGGSIATLSTVQLILSAG